MAPRRHGQLGILPLKLKIAATYFCISTYMGHGDTQKLLAEVVVGAILPVPLEFKPTEEQPFSMFPYLVLMPMSICTPNVHVADRCRF